MCDVFISYKSEDYADADFLRRILETNNISCWMAPASIAGGSNYAKAIPEAIKNCRIFLLLVSNKTQQSIWVSKEINQAVNQNKIIMPYMIEECELYSEFNFYLNDVQRYDAYQSKSVVIRKMILEIWAILGISQDGRNVVIPANTSEPVSQPASKPASKPVSGAESTPAPNPAATMPVSVVFWVILTYFFVYSCGCGNFNHPIWRCSTL